MSEEPLFDPSLKKRKKKIVAFTEDPLGADADPTAPAPETIDNTTTNGEAVDLGPTTAHEMMLKGDEKEKKEDDEFKAMFGDMKKKKKKKEIPLDLVSTCCTPGLGADRGLGRRFGHIHSHRCTCCSSR